MQPEVNQLIQDSNLEDPASPPPTPAQHGNCLRESSIPRSHFCECSGEQIRAADGIPIPPAQVAIPDPIEIPEQAITSAKRGKSGPHLDRVSEYENALSPSPNVIQPLGFKVIPSQTTGPAQLSIEDFPNEVLTHILSHLPPESLSSMNLVNHRFHGLVTAPHAWRIAFSRYFLGSAAAEVGRAGFDSEELDRLLSKKRAFCRLTALASWRSEYILRTRLLSSLSKGKPAEVYSAGLQNSSRIGSATPHSVITYNSQLHCPISHIDGIFGSELESTTTLFVHGASEQGIASVSDPSVGKSGIGAWGSPDPLMFNHFSELFPGDCQWGLGSGEVVGHPNVMDVSRAFGIAYGEACPRGRTYFLASDEKRGRYLSLKDAPAQPKLGIPRLTLASTSVTSVWIAKSHKILKITSGLCGIMAGTSAGILTSYAIGSHTSYIPRYERGQITARWAVCPGVPITAIRIDDNFSAKRHAQRRVWAVVLNALGEVFYLTGIPFQRDTNTKSVREKFDEMAWETGQTVGWEMIEATRRVVKPDPFNRSALDVSGPQGIPGDTKDHTIAQITTAEAEHHMALKPHHFRKVCEGWDMQRRLEVDFAGGDDDSGAGESVAVVSCGVIPEDRPSIKRYTRLHSAISSAPSPALISSGHGAASSASATNCWTQSDMVLDLPDSSRITTSTIDMSITAQLTIEEDPLLSISSGSDSSALSTPVLYSTPLLVPSQIPGHRARFIAVGTSTGVVIVWNIRAPTSQNIEVRNQIEPIRVIQTDSPEVSSVALTSLYLVHGGNDGLVQAWDPLGSSLEPIRTLNSRFSSRARRRLQQAQISVHGVGLNYFAAGAICLDPNPTRLRGIVSLGTQLRYWSYSSSGADHYKGKKRRLRYAKRGNNHSTDISRYAHTGRGAVQDYITAECLELKREKKEREQEMKHLRGRFGVDLLGPGASEEELLAYACMLSEESYTSDEKRRRDSGSSEEADYSNETIVPNTTSIPHTKSNSEASGRQYHPESSMPRSVDEIMESDVIEAIRRSLEDTSVLPMSPSPQTHLCSAGPAKTKRHSSHSNFDLSDLEGETDATQQQCQDLETAFQLSLADQGSPDSYKPEARRSATYSSDQLDDFPSLVTTTGGSRSKDTGGWKGKQKA